MPADFAAADTGQQSYVLAPDGFWKEKLTDEPRARWIGSGSSRYASETALFAVDFTLGPQPVTRATLSFRYLTDNFLGDATNEGLFLNGTPLAGSKLLPQVAANYDTDQACATFDVTSELRPGANTLYVYGVGAGSLGDPTGIQFCATFEVVQGPASATLPRLLALRTGDGSIGGLDARVRFLAGPAGGFGRVLSASDFTAAASGPSANVIAPDGGWRANLAADSAAQWIGTGATAASSATGLFSLDFTLGPDPIARATLDARCLVDNFLGDAQNEGLFLNGSPLPGTKLLAQVAANYETDQVFPVLDVSSLVVPGLNRLQVYSLEASPGGSPAGVQVTARLEVVSGSPPPIVRSVSPTSGTSGTSVTIRGIAFPPGATVTVGGAPLGNVVVVDATTITGVTSGAVAGFADVVVAGPTGTGTLVEGFEVP